jgi:hypothetical protein
MANNKCCFQPLLVRSLLLQIFSSDLQLGEELVLTVGRD